MKTLLKKFETVSHGTAQMPSGWDLRIVQNEDNLTYCLFNTVHREAIWIDPMQGDEAIQDEVNRELSGYRFLGVIDTHTHADHISNAAALAEKTGCPLIMHEKAPSRRVHLRISMDLAFSTASGPLQFLDTPGHTQDSLAVIWGPFICGADTILFNDTGRDDLPTGNPAAHYESLQKMKKKATPEMIFLTGHDGEARLSSWADQLKNNPALSQDLDTYLKDGGAYVGLAPKHLKISLFENFK